MIGMAYADRPSTGESLVRTPASRRVSLNNEPITRAKAESFLKVAGAESITLQFSNRNTRRRWGTAFYASGRVILYRHSTWMFLHEVAHILDWRRNKQTGHGPSYARMLDDLHTKWTEWERGNA